LQKKLYQCEGRTLPDNLLAQWHAAEILKREIADEMMSEEGCAGNI
jgi:hypothetical protein